MLEANGVRCEVRTWFVITSSFELFSRCELTFESNSVKLIGLVVLADDWHCAFPFCLLCSFVLVFDIDSVLFFLCFVKCNTGGREKE